MLCTQKLEPTINYNQHFGSLFDNVTKCGDIVIIINFKTEL